ncbi:tRNA lysidine(34) synthetase TilS [Herbaspirillum sp. RTI4]|uniref:tRNA lysidine(34) synthetase TilS n=1 Tax=Herbaspirillum sp. RTI4 TaxID=3048640 RepID=UPI002AB5C906|nr:tRNA lysidine(34) synthetase TilS [Herbaspirillum sp. RTI4]MDY7578633.1 tRNA lysidine(34) synthetase TilS [Herbaspirillum sp. RTI4]MEA9981061.1 tRNA lysidine(34) synthetase TilS [Herbaspirillum sp. RTI4]
MAAAQPAAATAIAAGVEQTLYRIAREHAAPSQLIPTTTTTAALSAPGNSEAPPLPEAAFVARFPVVAVAYSGGLDSSVLLDIAQSFAQRHGVTLLAFHIHHGINEQADAWLAHCEQTCAQRGVRFDARRIALHNSEDSGIEEAARLGRYAALGELCRQHQVSLLLTAHHLDDQAETVLLQLLRGAGVAGLSGMDSANTAAALLGDAQLLIARPLLTLARSDLERYAQAQGITNVEDPSNADTRYARNALRHQVMPVLDASFPGFQHRFSRAARHMQAAQRLLVELAQQDLARCAQGSTLNVPLLAELNADRLDNLLRYWFAERGLRMPSSAWLQELRSQLLEAKSSAQLCVTHPACHIRRHRDRVYLTPRRAPVPEEMEASLFRWNGESQLDMPAYGGTLHIEPALTGIDPDWLRAQPLALAYRSGGERLRIAANRPAKSLKYHYQTLDIPAWERPYLPLVTAAEAMVYAAGIGHDCGVISEGPGRVLLRWQDAYFMAPQ